MSFRHPKWKFCYPLSDNNEKKKIKNDEHSGHSRTVWTHSNTLVVYRNSLGATAIPARALTNERTEKRTNERTDGRTTARRVYTSVENLR